MDNVEEMDKFLEKYNFPKLDQEEIENLNRPITSTEIETVIRNLPANKSQTISVKHSKMEVCLQGLQSLKHKLVSHSVLSLKCCYIIGRVISSKKWFRNQSLSILRFPCFLLPEWEWVRKISWRSVWLLTSVFLPGESHGQRRFAGYRAWCHKESDVTEVTEQSIVQCIVSYLKYVHRHFP